MVEQIKIIEKRQSPEGLKRSDQIVYVVSGPGRVSVETVYDKDIEAMMETYHREGDTYTGGKVLSKCRCGCSHS